MAKLTKEQIEKSKIECSGLTRGERRFLREREKEGICYTLRNIRTAEERKRLEEFNNTPKAKMLEEQRNLLQRISDRKKEEDLQHHNNVIQTKNELLEHIKNLYKTHEIVTNQQFNDMFQCVEMSLRLLENLCKEARVMQFYSSSQKSEYEKLFDELIQNIDVRFVTHAPKRLFKYKSFYAKLKVVDIDTFGELKKRINSFESFENKEVQHAWIDYQDKCERYYQNQLTPESPKTTD